MAQQTEKRLRIAVLSRHFSRYKGGAENYAVSMAEQLANDHEIHVYCQSHSNQHPGINTHVMGIGLQKPRWLNMLIFSAWTFWHTRQGFDIVHSHENVFHGNVQTFHVKPVTHNLFHGKQGFMWLLACLKVAISPRLIAWLVVERARVRHPSKRLLITASSLLKDIYLESFQLPSSTVKVLTPGVTIPIRNSLEATATAKQTARQQLGLTSEQHWVLMVGHNFTKKGLHALMQALCLLPEELSLAVVGENSHIPVWASKARQWGLQDRVVFLGKQTQMEQVYMACDLLVHATLEDVFPIVVMEAMAHGLPVVVSPAPYCLSSELLTPDVNAVILKDPHDAQALASQVWRIHQDNAFAAQLAANALEYVQDYRWDTLSQTQWRLYCDLLK